MQYRLIAETGCRVSRIGLGTVKFGRNSDVKYPAGFELPSDKVIRELLAISREHGVNLLDTAPAYGNSEERLGRLLVGQRQHWTLCTKVGEHYRHGRSAYDFSATSIRESIEGSLLRLRTDCIDIALIHSDGSDLVILQRNEAIPALENLRREGKIRSIGMSCKTIEGGLAALEVCDLAMVTYNRSNMGERPVLDSAAVRHRGILVKKALDSGHLANDPRVDSLRSALKFALDHVAVSSVILGTIDPLHWAENLRLYGEVEAELTA